MITKRLEPIDPEMIQIKKTVYDEPDPTDGVRILIMSLWPRGVRKTRVDAWMKDLSCDVRTIREWKNGSLTRIEFHHRYLESLRSDPTKNELLKEIADKLRRGRPITLLCSCKDPKSCHRSFIKEELLGLI